MPSVIPTFKPVQIPLSPGKNKLATIMLLCLHVLRAICGYYFYARQKIKIKQLLDKKKTLPNLEHYGFC